MMFAESETETFLFPSINGLQNFGIETALMLMSKFRGPRAPFEKLLADGRWAE